MELWQKFYSENCIGKSSMNNVHRVNCMPQVCLIKSFAIQNNMNSDIT
jgi:hypothetical protein